MKLIIEDTDVEAVVKCLAESQDVFLTPEQAKSLIERDEDLSRLLFEEVVAGIQDSLLEWATEDSEDPKHSQYGWYWPNGRHKGYEEEFLQEFRVQSAKLGIALGKSWDN